jgi:tryptophan synthase alpha chain
VSRYDAMFGRLRERGEGAFGAFLMLGYANIVVARGMDAFCGAAAQVGLDSLLVADVPAFEAEPFVAAARARNVAPVLIAAQNTSDQVLGRIASLGGGYTYCVARAGVTGEDKSLSLDHSQLFEALARHGAPPPVLGFGISQPEHVRAALEAGAAGVISGSAIVRRVEENLGNPDAMVDAVSRFVSEMKAATRQGS